MSYEPRGFPYLIKANKAVMKRRSARHLNALAENYTKEEQWVRNFRSTAKKLDGQASDLESEIKGDQT
jgi:hypothetical protein